MMKAVGAALIFISGGAVCRSLLLQRRRELRTLEALARDMRRIGGEIRCRLTPLPELMDFASAGAGAETRPFWSEIAAMSGKPGAPPLREIFSAAAENLAVGGEARAALSELGRSFAGLDETGVLRGVETAVADISALAGEKRAQARDGRRIIVCACFSLSALLAILLA